nr:JAB-like toxin 1 domain-containing protein [Flavobacterium sp. ASV13]
MSSKASFFISTNIKQTENIYKFFAKNTNVEWQYNVFQGKNTVATLATSHTGKSIENYADLPSRVMENSDIKWIYNSHSHPGKFDPDTNWPAYPSGYTNDLKYSPEEGDRDYYFLYKKDKYQGRVPSMFNIFISTRPDIDVNYDDNVVKRTIPATKTH